MEASYKLINSVTSIVLQPSPRGLAAARFYEKLTADEICKHLPGDMELVLLCEEYDITLPNVGGLDEWLEALQKFYEGAFDESDSPITKEDLIAALTLGYIGIRKRITYGTPQ